MGEKKVFIIMIECDFEIIRHNENENSLFENRVINSEEELSFYIVVFQN